MMMYKLELKNDGNSQVPTVELDIEAEKYSVENIALNNCLDQVMRFYNCDEKTKLMNEIVLMISVKRVKKLTKINVIHEE